MSYTTNAEDQKAAAEMQARLKENRHRPTLVSQRLPSVHVDEGTHKYVLIKAFLDGEEQHFVTSKQGAAYHRNAAEPMIVKLEEAGYHDIEVTGGGRISYLSGERSMKIYGFSYGFGRAEHDISRRVVEADPSFQGFTVSTSNEGY